ncbi:MAG: tetratricopeptide repeat protein [Prevotellaceae bacterium]|nr:tetratricopeptide repeat protein [Prevotellaceae bacterium]MDY6129733.1 tetratricopeptide repeat protein [Prevotella sp.]
MSFGKSGSQKLFGMAIVCICAMALASCARGMSRAGQSAVSFVKPPAVPQLSYNDEQRFKYFFHEALGKQMAGEYDAAFDLFNHCLSINPYAAEVYSMQASYYAELNNDSTVLAYMKKAAELSPDNDIYLERLAVAHINSNNMNEAIRTYEWLYAGHKDRSDVLSVLLQLYNRQKDYDKMIHTINRLETVEGSSEQTALSRMRVYALQGKKREEFNELRTLSDKHPNDMNYHVMMGNWLLQNGKMQEALDKYNFVLKQDSQNLSAKLSMMDYYRMVGEDSLASEWQERMLLDPATPTGNKMMLMRKVVAENEQNGADSTEVLDLFEKMLAQPQQSSDMTELYAAYMKLKKMPQDCINTVLRKALGISPDNVGVRLQLIQALWEEKNFDEIIFLCRQATAYNPDEMAFYYFLGLAHFQKDEADEALDAFRRGVAQINAESNKDMVSDFYSIMGEILHGKGKDSEAFAAYDSSLQWKPENLPTLNNYAYYLSLQKESLSKAEQMSYRTVKAEPTNATYLDTYAWILFMQERYEEAKIYIDQTLQNDSMPTGVVLEHAGDIYAMNKDMTRALDYWQKARDAGNDSKVLARKIKLKKYIKE